MTAKELLREAKTRVVKTYEKGRYFHYQKTVLPAKEGNNLIGEIIREYRPSAIGKVGTTELTILLIKHERYHFSRSHRQHLLAHTPELANKNPKWLKMYRNREKFQYNGGIFPDTPEIFEAFGSCYEKALGQVDLLAAWFNPGEAWCMHNFAQGAQLTSTVRSLEPYFYESPWSQHLHGKRVLVVHPFEKTIRQQYHRRKEIWAHFQQEVLPEFDLDTVKVQQNAAVVEPIYSDWFEGLRDLKRQVSAKDFDIAIIGAGGWSIPLATHVKKMGKIGIHLGGAVQILFGIKGGRWDEKQNYTDNIYGSNWTRVLESELPDKLKYSQITMNDQYW
jgi:hypothetical protein